MGVCQTFVSFLANPFTYAGAAGLGVIGKFLYMRSSYTFWPSFLTITTVWRTVMTTLSGLTSLRSYGLFTGLALVTTFSETIKYVLQGDVELGKLLFTAGAEFYDKVVLAVKHLVEGTGFLAEWLGQGSQVCTLVGSNELFFAGVWSIWTGLAAYIFALRLYDWWFGKGMTREVEWPEAMLVVAVVTLASTTVYGAELLTQGAVNGVSLFEELGNTSIDVNESNLSDS